MSFDYHNAFATATATGTSFLSSPYLDILSRLVFAVVTGVLTWCITTILSNKIKKLTK